MSKIILGIHGMGNKPPAPLLQEWWQRSIDDGLEACGLKNTYYDFELIYWANFIHPLPLDPATRSSDNPLYIEDPYMPPRPIRKKKPRVLKKKLLDYLEKQLDKLLLNEDLSINFAAITDLIIKHFYRDLDIYLNAYPIENEPSGMTARELILNSVKDHLQRHRRRDIILLAHSMGSLIAYDILLENRDIKIDSFITFGSPLSVPVLMQRLAFDHGITLSDRIVLPVPDNIRRSWINIADIDDRVAFNYTLADDFDPNKHGVRPVDIQVFNDYRYNDTRNPHKSYGYLRTPEMTKAIFDALIYGRNKYMLWLDNTIKRRLKNAGRRHAA